MSKTIGKMSVRLKLNLFSEEELLNMTPPDITDSYTPISHREFIENIKEQLDKVGFNVKTSNYKSDGSGQKLIGIYGIEYTDSEVGLMMAFRNSYDKSMSAGVVIGGQVWICENGMISGDVQLIRKHTGDANIVMENKIIDSINHFEEGFDNILFDRDRMKETEVTIQQRAETLGRLFIQENYITSNQLGIIKEEISSSKTFTGNSLWSFYNHITEALKITNPRNYLDRHIQIHKFIKDNLF